MGPRRRAGARRAAGGQFLLLRQLFMKALRSSPFLSAACVLHAFIFSCWVIGFEAAIVDEADRQFFMKAFRSSPFLSPACLLHMDIFDCWLFWAKTGDASRLPTRRAAKADRIFI